MTKLDFSTRRHCVLQSNFQKQNILIFQVHFNTKSKHENDNKIDTFKGLLISWLLQLRHVMRPFLASNRPPFWKASWEEAVISSQFFYIDTTLLASKHLFLLCSVRSNFDSQNIAFYA